MYGRADVYQSPQSTRQDLFEDAFGADDLVFDLEDEDDDEDFGGLFKKKDGSKKNPLKLLRPDLGLLAITRKERQEKWTNKLEQLLGKLKTLFNQGNLDRARKAAKSLKKIVTKLEKVDDEFDPSPEIVAWLDFAGGGSEDALKRALGAVSWTGEGVAPAPVQAQVPGYQAPQGYDQGQQAPQGGYYDAQGFYIAAPETGLVPSHATGIRGGQGQYLGPGQYAPAHSTYNPTQDAGWGYPQQGYPQPTTNTVFVPVGGGWGGRGRGRGRGQGRSDEPVVVNVYNQGQPSSGGAQASQQGRGRAAPSLAGGGGLFSRPNQGRPAQGRPAQGRPVQGRPAAPGPLLKPRGPAASAAQGPGRLTRPASAAPRTSSGRVVSAPRGGTGARGFSSLRGQAASKQPSRGGKARFGAVDRAIAELATELHERLHEGREEMGFLPGTIGIEAFQEGDRSGIIRADLLGMTDSDDLLEIDDDDDDLDDEFGDDEFDDDDEFGGDDSYGDEGTTSELIRTEGPQFGAVFKRKTEDRLESSRRRYEHLRERAVTPKDWSKVEDALKDYQRLAHAYKKAAVAPTPVSKEQALADLTSAPLSHSASARAFQDAGGSLGRLPGRPTPGSMFQPLEVEEGLWASADAEDDDDFDISVSDLEDLD